MSKSLTFPHKGMEQSELLTEVHQLREGVGNVCVSVFLSYSDDTSCHSLSNNMIVDCIVFLSQDRFRDTCVFHYYSHNIIAEHAARSDDWNPEAFKLNTQGCY